jgi:basic membrane protein A
VTHESKTPLHSFVGQEAIDQVKVLYEEIIAGNKVVENPLSE